MPNYLELIQRIDDLVSKHSMDEAREELRLLDVDLVPGKLKAEFASLARRVGDVKLSLNILQNNVYGVGQPSNKDILEYSSSLRKLGLINQALNLLERLDHEAEVHLHKAFCYISIWDYRSAKSELEDFLKYDNLSEKKILVAQVNLVTCLLEENLLEEAQLLLEEIIPKAKDISWHLYLNALENYGQLYIKKKRYEEAIKVLEDANLQSKDQVGRTSLFIHKWLVIARCFEGSLSVDSEEVRNFRKEIRQMHHWETLRDFDWHMAKISNNKELMDYNFFGTPFKGFRKNIINDIGGDIWPSYYIWKDRNKGDLQERPIDLYSLNELPLPYGLGLHRLWMLFASDFYRPWTVGRIFNSLFPDELYDPISSPKKVYRLIEKLMKVLKGEKVDVTLGSTIHGYRLRLNPGAHFVLHRKMQFSSQEEFLYHLLIVHGFSQPFSKKDVVDCIPMSQHQWYRALKKMEELGWLIKSKQGKNLFCLKKAS